MKIEVHHIHDTDKDTDKEIAERLCWIERGLGVILRNQEKNMIDTSKLLEAVEKETTDNASMRALLQSTFAALTQVKADLAVAIAASDPAAIAAAQKDIDAVVEKLNLDDQATKDALAANVDPAPAPVDPTPADPAA